MQDESLEYHLTETRTRQSMWNAKIREWLRATATVQYQRMEKMTIRITKISTQTGLVSASLAVDVPSLGAKARIEMSFPAPPGTGPEVWRELAYARALMMLDPE